MILTVELKPSKNESEYEVEIYCDSNGLDKLIADLHVLKNSKKNIDHVHFNTPSWAGNELTEVQQGKGNVLVNHLVIAVKK